MQLPPLLTQRSTAQRGATMGGRAFTLVEMLVVLGIIGILAAMTLPSFKNSKKGNSLEAALQQLMGDLAEARLRAMSSRTPVFLVFCPDLSWYGTLNPAQLNMLYTNVACNTIVGGQLTTYALFSPRIVGEQPGQNTPHYITDWRNLPNGIFIPAGQFRQAGIFHNVVGSPQSAIIPADDSPGSPPMNLPYIAFDEQGRLMGRSTNVVLSFLEGSIMHPQDTNGIYLVPPAVPYSPDAIETSEPIQLNGIAPGIGYLVAGAPGSTVVYNATSYSAGQSFVGAAGQTTYAVSAGTPRVVQNYGVRIEWITGRARAVKPESP